MQPPHEQPELLGAWLAQHWSLPVPFSLALHLSRPCHATAQLQHPVPRTETASPAYSEPSSHAQAQPFVLPICAQSADAASDEAVEAFAAAAAGYLVSAQQAYAVQSVDGEDVSAIGCKLQAADTAAAVATRAVLPANAASFRRVQMWCQRNLPDAGLLRAPLSETARAWLKVNAERSARGQEQRNPYAKPKAVQLSGEDEAQLGSCLAFPLPALEYDDLMAKVASKGPAVLNGRTARDAFRVVATFPYVRHFTCSTTTPAAPCIGAAISQAFSTQGSRFVYLCIALCLVSTEDCACRCMRGLAMMPAAWRLCMRAVSML